MNATTLAAWWGALVATVVLAWDVYKWKKSGPIINVTTSPNMQMYKGVEIKPNNETFLVVEVTNIGDRKTTLTHLVGLHYKSMFQRLRNKTEQAFFVLNPAMTTPLPYVLEPGERWVGGIAQTDDLEEMCRRGYFYCGVYHSGSKRPALQRVTIQKTHNQ